MLRRLEVCPTIKPLQKFCLILNLRVLKINFPVFNFADICVTLSVILIVILFIFKYNDEDHDIILGIKNEKEKNKEENVKNEEE